ncbi:hypothetical protein ACU5AX_17070 [Sphingomonas sp. XXL09]
MGTRAGDTARDPFAHLSHRSAKLVRGEMIRERIAGGREQHETGTHGKPARIREQLPFHSG